MERIEIARNLLGKELHTTLTKLDDGISVLLVGGDKTHIGAVSLCEPQKDAQTILLSGHREAVISERWATYLSDWFNTTVCVECGIHYNEVSKEALDTILVVCENLLCDIAAESSHWRQI